MLHPSELSSSMESIAYEGGLPGPQPSQNQQNTRTKRMRTSFKHHQLRTMKSYFAINQNPDAKDLKQLAQKTGLSKRVLQVRNNGGSQKSQLIFLSSPHLNYCPAGLVSKRQSQMETKPDEARKRSKPTATGNSGF